MVRSLKIGIGGAAAVAVFVSLGRHFKERRSVSDCRTLFSYLNDVETEASNSPETDRDLLVHVSADGALLFMNRAFVEFLGGSAEMLGGRNFLNILSTAGYTFDAAPAGRGSELNAISEGAAISTSTGGSVDWVVRRLPDSDNPDNGTSFLVVGWRSSVYRG